MHLSWKRVQFVALVAFTLVNVSVDARSAPPGSIAQQAYVKASNTQANDRFGVAVAISGDTMVVAADLEDSNATGVNGNEADNSKNEAGAVYVFVRSGATWTQQAYLKASNTGPMAHFGTSLAISGDTIVVGSPYESSNATGVNGNEADVSMFHAGAAYVFVRNGTTWTQQAYLKASNTGVDEFGISVGISGDTIIVGSYKEGSSATGVNGNETDNSAPGSGAAYIFVREGTTWSQQAYLKASNTGVDDYFGVSVSISGDTAVAGAFQEDSNATGVNGNESNNSFTASGAAYVFARNGTTWSQQAYLKASNAGTSDQFGAAVAISGETIVVGAYTEASRFPGVNANQTDDSLFGSGAAYVFVRSGSTWGQQAYLKASNAGVDPNFFFGDDHFGWSVSISGDRIAVGASTEQSNATGVNGNGANDSLTRAGAAYSFLRSGTTWTEEAYIKASNTAAQDAFGWSIAVSGGRIAVGAQYEDSSAVGIDGNQASNSAADSGAVYVFQESTPTNSYCSGDGSDTACPCGNQGLPGRGCDNTAASGGAQLASFGAASIAADTLVFSATSAVPFGPGLFYQGSTTANPAAPFGIAFGNGLRCVGGTTPRLEVQLADGTGASGTTVPIHVLGSCVASDTRYYQLWYRDAGNVGTCAPGFGFNLTNALSLTWLP